MQKSKKKLCDGTCESHKYCKVRNHSHGALDNLQNYTGTENKCSIAQYKIMYSHKNCSKYY